MKSIFVAVNYESGIAYIGLTTLDPSNRVSILSHAHKRRYRLVASELTEDWTYHSIVDLLRNDRINSHSRSLSYRLSSRRVQDIIRLLGGTIPPKYKVRDESQHLEILRSGETVIYTFCINCESKIAYNDWMTSKQYIYCKGNRYCSDNCRIEHQYKGREEV